MTASTLLLSISLACFTVAVILAAYMRWLRRGRA
mgnify:CR=1 FL=1